MKETHVLGESLKLWFGIVENSNDDESRLGRAKVRILGFHSSKKSELPTEELPWAIVMNSTDNPAVNGKGANPPKLKPGSMVCGFFLDGSDCQQPIVIGTIFSRIIDDAIQENKPKIDSIEDFQNPGAVFISEENPDEPLTTVEEIAKSEEFNIANPLGRSTVTVADGNRGSERVMFFDIANNLNSLVNSFKDSQLYIYEGVSLTGNLTKEQSAIEVGNTEFLPHKGIIQIDDELISYSEKNDRYLVEVNRGIYGTEAKAHRTGSGVSFPQKEAEGRPKEIVSKITGKVIDYRKEVNRIISKIRNYIKWLVNSIKSTLTSIVSDTLVKIGSLLKSIFPYQTKVVIETLYKVLQRIECDFGLDFINSLVNDIEKYIEDLLNKTINKFLKGALDFLGDVQSCVNDIFDSFLSISLMIEGVLGMIDSAVSVISKANKKSRIETKTEGIREKLGQLSVDKNPDSLLEPKGTSDAIESTLNGDRTNNFVSTVNNVGNTIGLLLDLLGIGCNKSTSPAKVDVYSTLNSGIAVECAEFVKSKNIQDSDAKVYSRSGCSFIYNELNILEILKQYRRPVYSLNKIISYGNNYTEEIDSTPGAERYSKTGPAKTSEEILEDGTRVVTVNGDDYQVIIDNEHVNIKGTCYVTVEGDYHLKVNGDYHLEVLGEYNLLSGAESKMTFCGEHTTIYKNSAKLNSHSGIALSGSKIGLSSAGNIDLETQGAMTLTSGEYNAVSTGSYNIGCLAYNKTVLGNNISTIVRDKIELVGSNKIGAVSNTNTGLVGNSKTTLVSNAKVDIQNGSRTNITGGLDTSNASGLKLRNSNSSFELSQGLQAKLNKSFQLNKGSTHVIT